MKVLFVLALLALSAFAQKLGSYNVVPSEVTVGGLSSGGFMAVQFHVAFSSEIKGASVFAAGPYYCAQGQIANAFTNCMYVPSGIDVRALVSAAQGYESKGLIDSLSNLASSKVFFYSGTKDSVVAPGSVKAAHQWYSTVGVTNMSTVFNIPSQHCFPTTNYGNACDYLGTPYIDNCAYDGAGTAMDFLHGPLAAKGTAKSSNILKFDQTEFVSNANGNGMNTIGYAYVPTACQEGHACSLHIALHGCSQTIADIGDVYYTKTGINDWAESNNIIVLYPQAYKMSLSNPNGCWDWWGYTNSNYAVKTGIQMDAIHKMMYRLMGRL